MALMIREYTGDKFIKTNEIKTPLNLTEATIETNVSDEAIDPNSLMVEIEGIHAYPHATRNFTRYMPKCLKNSISLWTTPYRRPLIKHHNEENGEIIGRICAAEYKTSKTLSGTPALVFTVNVPGEEAKKDVKNGILSTASIGVMAYDVRCSICGTHLEDGDECEHERGREYTVNGKKEVCYWDVYSMEPKELSYVIVPSDIYAKNTKIYPATNSRNKPIIKECLNNKGVKKMPNNDDLEKELKEAKDKIAKLEQDIKDLTEDKTNSENKISELTETNSKLAKQVADLNEAKNKLEEEKLEEAQLREGVENALAEAKKETREYMVHTLQAMRQAIGKEALADEMIKNRTVDSIKDSICDLKEEFNLKTSKKNPVNSLPNPDNLKNPTLANNKPVKEKKEKQNSNIDLEEGLKNIVGSLFNTHLR
ncbi:hypothetical protein ACTQX2_00320 [Megamonas funiformis]|jgi:hypothetical protein|uniref:hypothetical protein n=1 Tax=Megamonas funiformis TaxID=437897 RepID=UPI003F94D384